MNEVICSRCHATVKDSDYYCFNCGKNLKPVPLPTSISDQAGLYIKSLILPPMGIIWGIRYLRQPGRNAKIIGIIAIGLTIIFVVVLIRLTINLTNQVNQQMQKQFDSMSYF